MSLDNAKDLLLKMATSGAYHVIYSIPGVWSTKIEKIDYFFNLSTKLTEKKQNIFSNSGAI